MVSKQKTKKLVYDFSEGNTKMKQVLGGKGANLAEMTQLGLPVPQGFTITTEASVYYMEKNENPPGLDDEIDIHLKTLESTTRKKLGDQNDPLLVSVRSGARVSMPGMMDTVLNLGINDDAVKGLTKQTGDERFAYDSYRRFIQMFGNVVLGVEGDNFEDAIIKAKEKKGVKDDTDLDANDLKSLVETFKDIVKKNSGKDFPTDPKEQLDYSIKAVFKSWNNKRAQDYRNLYKIPDNWGTAVNVQTMVFGNKGKGSGTGVAFTRSPATGRKVIYGDYLMNAQGEDVVAGIRNTIPLRDMEKNLPKIFSELVDIMNNLEDHYKEMNDIEFTIENDKLYMLQTRVGKRTAAAAIKIAVDMVEEGLIDKETALLRVEPAQLDQLLHPQFDPDIKYVALTKGLNASPGAAVGKVVLDANDAEEMGNNGEDVILTRWETTPDDLHGMIAASGILTSHGGKTSHAAVVARGMGKPCITGAEELKIDTKTKTVTINNTKIKEGDVISIDGTTGEVVLGEVKLKMPSLSDDFKTILSWADDYRTLGVRTNADTPEDAKKARQFGAEGIGLARTEHMFMGDRLPIVRKMILAENEKQRNETLQELLKVQTEDFIGIFEAMDDLPVTIRLLDPPLHEFLPSVIDLKVELIKLENEKAPKEKINKHKNTLERVEIMVEANPMLGLRGCRLGITHPEIYKMQVKAIMEAAVNRKKAGGNPIVEIMIPLVSLESELSILRAESEEVIKKVLAENKIDVEYKIGTMIELPRAALISDEIAKHADFFSYGTNDLTQTTFGFSRDDIEAKFLPTYLERKIMPINPFETIDVKGVGKLVEMSVELGRKTNKDIKLGICGEHGGDPESVELFHKIGLDYVSASPYRIPIARLAAARSAIKDK